MSAPTTTPKLIHDFVAWVVIRFHERMYRARYRRERECYSEWVDLGGEGGGEA